MKKNVMKKVASTVLAAIMVSAVGFSVLADSKSFPGDGEETSVVISEDATNGLEDVTFKVKFDKDPSSAQLPVTQFSYTIAPGTAMGATGEGVTPAKPAIYAGPVDGVLFDTGVAATPTANNITTDEWSSAVGGGAYDELKLDFDNTKFVGGAGIYRYVITQTALTDEQQDLQIKAYQSKDNSGEKQWTTDAVTRYLDVYVDSTGKVTSCVMLTQADQPEMQEQNDGSYEAAYPVADKTDGFENKETFYDFEVEKEVEGSMGNTVLEFPFTITTTYLDAQTTDANTNATGVQIAYSILKADGTTKSSGTTTVGATLTDVMLAHGEKIVFEYVPATVQVSVTETVKSSEGYTITAETSGDTLTEDTNNTNQPIHTGALVVATVTAADSSAATYEIGNITFTNARQGISPTGVILRYAPYIIMIAAAAVLVVMVVKSKKNNEEEA